MEAYKQPTQLMNDNQLPDLDHWWQYIAYGAAKKVFEDRTDMGGVSMIMPEFKEQERFVLRRTLVQNSNNRVATIYSEATQRRGGWGNNRG